MPELFFKGKEYVYNHHLTVPYRPLLPDAKKSIGAADLGGNLVIHGDNLHALKSLLPRYAGKVDLVFIDPPYNTGNENWSYNDNVNSPIMQEWLRSNPVNAEDMLRHDKWLCMMWPRLTLLRELLSERGSLWMTLDDNEVHRAIAIFDEIFGVENHEATIAWEKRFTRSNNATRFSSSKDWIVVYRKSEDFHPGKEVRSEESQQSYSNPDGDAKGLWISVSYVNPAVKADRPNLVYKIKNPFTKKWVEHETNAWKFSPETNERHIKEKRLWWGLTGDLTYPRLKVYLTDGVVPVDLWSHEFAGTTDQAFKELESILGRGAFDTIKPVKLIERVLELASKPDSIVLDSFAGSGTTAHAVLKQNARDGGGRKFILVEGENYADSTTAERVRRVIKGYAWSGNQREELLRENLTWTQLQKPEKLLTQVAAIRQKEGFGDESGQMSLMASPSPQPSPRKRGEEVKAKAAGQVKRRFDKINVSVKDGELIVEGEKKISQRVEGLGGEFTYCTLGEALDPEGILSGKTLPDYDNLGAWLYYAATGGTLERRKVKAKEFYLGEALDKHVWLIYRPDLKFLKSADAALTLSFARTLREKKPGKTHLVFAAAKFLSNRQLLELGVEFAALPYTLYRGV